MTDPGTDLEAALVGWGASLTGFADLSVLPAGQRFGFPRGVVIGAQLDPGVIAGIADGPTLPYAAEYERANTLLTELGQRAAAFLEERGHQADAVVPTGEDFDPDTLAARFPHKTAATRSGLAWVGKCALAVNPDLGTAVRWCTVLTDAPLPTGIPQEQSQCGACAACVNACPAGAPTGKHWKPRLPRAELLDAHACRANCRTVSDAIGVEHTICGICIPACPWTRRYLARAGMAG